MGHTGLMARREALLARCQQQRVEIAGEVARLKAKHPLLSLSGLGALKREKPPAWVAGAAALLLLLIRPRRVLGKLTWLTGAVTLVSRATRLMRLVSQRRAVDSEGRTQ